MIFEKQIVNYFKGMMYTRCDDDGTAFYFSASDFDGLHAEPMTFLSKAGHTLKGYLYRYNDIIPGRIVVFDHGFGGGHRAYMKEIEKLCKHGYLVFSYDHTGCMESEGDSPNGLAQSLCDLDDCICFIKEYEYTRGLDISVIGHSWGGYSTLNIAAIHPDISHIVVFSGFIAVDVLVNDFFKGALKGYRKAIMQLEKTSNPEYVHFNAVESLSKTNAQVLLVYSDNDQMVKIRQYDLLKAGLSGKPNVKLILEKNKGHNPNYTEDAVRYLGEYLNAKKKLLRKKMLVTNEQKNEFLASFDWQRMTVQDETVWANVFDCLDA